MARTKKFTEIEAKERRKVQTREAVRRTRKKKSEITIISQGPITLVEENFLPEQPVEEWEIGYKTRKSRKSRKPDCIEAVLADPRGTLKIDDSIPDAVPADAMTKEQWERAVKAGLIPSEGAEALRDDPVKEEWET